MEEKKVNFVLQQEFNVERLSCNELACSVCRGIDCCQNCGCAFSPDDFYVFRNPFTKEERKKYLISFLKRGYTSIEHIRMYDKEQGAFNYEDLKIFHQLDDFQNLSIYREKLLAGDGVLYLRTRNVGKPVNDMIHLHPESDGPCILWSEQKGCELSYKKRPKGGRLLIPDPNKLCNMYSLENHCTPLYMELQSAIDWFPYQDILFEVYTYFRKHNNY